MAQSNFIEEPLLLDKECYFDQRGYFKETYRKEWFQEIDNSEFNQDNLSFSLSKGTLRGMHLQKHPFAQSKIVQCLQGKIIDIVVDLRSESKNYTKYFKYEMEGKDNLILYVPQGFAHGFLTLEENTMVLYKVNNYYDPESEISISWNDPILNLPWPMKEEDIILAKKDSEAISFNELDIKF